MRTYNAYMYYYPEEKEGINGYKNNYTYVFLYTEYQVFVYWHFIFHSELLISMYLNQQRPMEQMGQYIWYILVVSKVGQKIQYFLTLKICK